MTQLVEQVPNRAQVRRGLAPAGVQIAAIERAERAEHAFDEAAAPAVDAFPAAGIIQLLQAVTAALDGLNHRLPDPLPPTHSSRRNLRDRFAAVASRPGPARPT